ncbi:MAG: DegT/DnrJ/EryC1/StrS family aminotransferase [Candidatus Riflebacteria bacterium]|nr:DegT/DnrJ/EryC1/StrS family aminotransferase [Candidatus Riflebacteria bacterium]
MINVTKAYLPDKEKLFGYINKIYESGWLTNNGQFCKQLETRLKDFLGVKNLILVSNGTLALQVAYKALNVTGSAVTTPFSFVATASSLLWEGISPVFADINPLTWNLAPENIEKAIKADTSAIVPVHVFGNPCDVEAIQKIAQKNDLKVIYDGAHAFGVKYKGESILNWGDVTTLSFHATKLFHTIEGGAIITSDDELARKIRLLINFGITGPETIECVGINCKINEFQAAMGLCVLDEMEEIATSRKKVWDYYRSNLPANLVMQQWNLHSSQNYHYYPVLFESESTLKKTQRAFNNEQIFPRRYFYPSLDSLKFSGNTSNMPLSQDISRRILCLPIFPELTTQEQQQILKILSAYQ